MPSLWFVVPLHGRRQLAAICLRQLRRTCDELTTLGIYATAVVIADRQNLRDMRGRIGKDMLGFGTVERDNRFVSRRFNDGLQLACDPRHNPQPADFVVPCGSDDWVDSLIFTHLPNPDTVLCFQRLSFVREDGLEMTTRFLGYPGGAGIRIYPRQIIEQAGYRVADEDRPRGCDTSILYNARARVPGLQIAYREIDPRQIVDWKTDGANLNPYDTLSRHRMESASDPFEELVGFYPDAALDEMAAHYRRVQVAA